MVPDCWCFIVVYSERVSVWEAPRPRRPNLDHLLELVVYSERVSVWEAPRPRRPNLDHLLEQLEQHAARHGG